MYKDIQKQVLGTMEIDKLTVSNEALQINRYFLRGLLTSNEAIQKIVEKYSYKKRGGWN